jgi:predicted transcriptional regulator of viral defense system
MYLAFEKTFRDFPIFSIRDIKKRYPDFDNRRLVEWQQKGYILKIRRGFYCFKEHGRDENFLYYAANKIYSPSYVSFESALNYYSIIPEGTFTITSATTRNTANFETTIGNYTFRHLKSMLFFAYKLIQGNGFTIKIAEPEKVILDYFYLNKINSLEEMEGMRLNEIQLKKIIDFQKLQKYQNIFNSSILNRRVQLFKKAINA